MKTEPFVTTAFKAGTDFKVRNRQAMDHWVKLQHEGEFVLTIERRHATRSQSQNAYYWGVVAHLISEHTGYTPDEVHEFLKMKFLPKRLALQDRNGVIEGEYVVGGSTTKLNKLQFGEYLAQIQQWAAETLDVVIPDPTERAA